MVLADNRYFYVIHSLNILDFVICVTMPLKKYQWWGLLFKKELWPHYYVSRLVEGESILLPRVAFKDEL